MGSADLLNRPSTHTKIFHSIRHHGIARTKRQELVRPKTPPCATVRTRFRARPEQFTPAPVHQLCEPYLDFDFADAVTRLFWVDPGSEWGKMERCVAVREIDLWRGECEWTSGSGRSKAKNKELTLSFVKFTETSSGFALRTKTESVNRSSVS
jgi:hypothetical protein